MSTKPYLEIRIQKNFAGFQLDVCWNAGNEMVVLFGPSGAGKSMTLQAISGLLKIQQGFIRIGDQVAYDSVSGIDISPQKRETGYLFQNFALFPHMTARKNILYGHHHPGSPEAKKRLIELINLIDLEGLENRYPGELSRGQQQRVALARALMRNPKILLLDEPFASIDLLMRRTLRKELKELQKRITIPAVIVTHDLSEAITMADQLILYNQGKVLQQGSPEWVINHPQNELVAELVGKTSLDNVKNISF
ncbi:MAG: ABC transporter ATP-binding protein [Nitrospirae bacterium]|nr:ABC transporter ATP-binding protein [Nitrospirota bacterium]